MLQSLESLSQRKHLKKGILILDSGLGAISMLQEIRTLIPNTPLIAVADSVGFPYGEKDDLVVIERIRKLAQYFSTVFDPAVLVLACNTASTLALPHLRSELSIPIVGVVPAVKPAAEMSKTRVIAVLATPATVGRTYLSTLIDQFATDCSVLCIPCPDLASLAEEKLRGRSPSLEKVRQELLPLIEDVAFDSVDTVVLACTHFSFLSDELAQLLPNRQIVDPVSSVARQVKRVKTVFEESEDSHTCLVLTAPIVGDDDKELTFSAIDEIVVCSI